MFDDLMDKLSEVAGNRMTDPRLFREEECASYDL